MKTMLAAAALALAAAAHAAVTPPDELVKTVMLEIQQALAAARANGTEDREKNVQLIERKALPHFNQRGMTALAVGVHWRKATPAQKARLVEEFRTLILRTYASSLSAFADQKFEFRPAILKPTDADTTVQVRVLQTGAQPVLLEYDMERTPEGWKCYDVRIAGISLVVNYRTEFGIIVRDKGIDGLIEALATKNKSLEAKSAAGK